jgi:hypothetical protein
MGFPKYQALSNVMAYFEPDWKRTKKKKKKEKKGKQGPWCGMGASVLVQQQLLFMVVCNDALVWSSQH